MSSLSYAGAVLACAATTALAALLTDYFDLANIVMLFLLTVLLVAVWLGRGPAVMAAFLSVALFDFFFVPPKLSFAVNDAQYLLTFAVMLAVARVISHIARRPHGANLRMKAGSYFYVIFTLGMRFFTGC
jgi:two-component system sensor histidine kinase KdpD